MTNISNTHAIAGDLMACLFPSCCVACECPLRYSERTFCLHCRREFSQKDSVATAKAKHKFDIPLEGILISNVFHTSGKTQRTLHAMKYRYRRDVAVEAGRIMAESINDDLGGILIPVPQTPKKRRTRGYNQAEIMAVAIAESTGLELVTSLLGRAGSHRSQTTKTRTDRIKTMGIYCKAIRKIEAPVWLIDDVVTTGATLNACIDVLLATGVSKIGVMAWATA